MKKYKYNVQYFEKIDTEAKAYWFGFIMADGCIRLNGKTPVLEVTLAECDSKHLSKLRDILSPDNRLYPKTKKLKGKVFRHVRLVISSKKIANDLRTLGCTERKSLTAKMPKSVPTNLLSHFMRGYFDGDGSIHISDKGNICFSLNGSRIFLSKYRDHLLKTLKISYTKVYNSSSQIKEYKKDGIDSVKILRYLYKHATVLLERKYRVFMSYRRLQKCRKIAEKIGKP